MIAKKPTIVIYTHRADESLLKEVCAGIEEEGVLYEIAPHTGGAADELSLAACDTSMLGVVFVSSIQSFNLFHQVFVNEWTFFQTTTHFFFLPFAYLPLRRLTISLLEAFFVLRVLTPIAFLPHGVIGDLRPIGVRPSPPP